MTELRIESRVRWVVQQTSIQVFDGAGSVWTLAYPQAAVWDLLSRQYPVDKVSSMLTFIAGLDARDAAAVVDSSIRTWRDDGLLVEGKP